MANQENEAEILYPDASIIIKGESIEVKEFSFPQGLKVNAMAAPLIKALSAFFTDDENADFSAMSSVFDMHSETLIELMSISINKPTEWFNTLTDTEGQALLMTFWSVNKVFFINRLLLKGIAKQQA